MTREWEPSLQVHTFIVLIVRNFSLTVIDIVNALSFKNAGII